MTINPPVGRREWLLARKELLDKEKAFTRMRDDLSCARQALPWEQVAKAYVFTSTTGKQTLGQLFGACSQLIVYHFMFGANWKEGCKICSFWADGFDGIDVHLAQRDVSFAVVSRASIKRIEAFRQRMGWRFAWVSAANSSFSRDYGAAFTPAEIAAGDVEYNYAKERFPSTEAPGVSVFARTGEAIFHTYSCYARGLDMLNPAYTYLDLVPKGRDEGSLPSPMSWVRHHDRYLG